MARVNTIGLTELAAELKKNADTSRDRVRKMMKYGAEIASDSIKLKAYKHKLYLSGEMIASIKPGPVEISTNSAKVDVWPQGRRKYGNKRERNATVGFVQHYGRSYGKTKRAGTMFFDEGTEAAAGWITEGMAKIWHEGE